jgi:SAP domain-containing ribonucleoprotein
LWKVKRRRPRGTLDEEKNHSLANGCYHVRLLWAFLLLYYVQEHPTMTKYAGLLKAKLQELLTARGLPIDGTKEVLIERLEESDKIAAELDEEEDETAAEAPAELPQEAQESSVVTATDAPAAPAAPEAPIEESVDAKTDAVVGDDDVDDVDGAATATATQDEVAVTPELLKGKAVELLSRKLARAQKFGEDAQAAVLAADLARVEKFGVALDSIIARELGFGKPEPVVKKHGNIKGQNNNNNKNKNKNKNRNKGRLAEQRPHAVHSGRVYKTR